MNPHTRKNPAVPTFTVDQAHKLAQSEVAARREREGATNDGIGTSVISPGDNGELRIEITFGYGIIRYLDADTLAIWGSDDTSEPPVHTATLPVDRSYNAIFETVDALIDHLF